MSRGGRLGFRHLGEYAEGVRTAIRENATAYGYSIMITSSFGIVAGLEARPPAWAYALFALGGSLGFPVALAAATQGFRNETFAAERSGVILFASLLNSASVLAGVGGAALVAWPLHGWAAWLASPFAATIVYLAVNGIEWEVAEQEEQGAGGGS